MGYSIDIRKTRPRLLSVHSRLRKGYNHLIWLNKEEDTQPCDDNGSTELSSDHPMHVSRDWWAKNSWLPRGFRHSILEFPSACPPSCLSGPDLHFACVFIHLASVLPLASIVSTAPGFCSSSLTLQQQQPLQRWYLQQPASETPHLILAGALFVSARFTGAQATLKPPEL